jgi:hypothetical protein
MGGLWVGLRVMGAYKKLIGRVLFVIGKDHVLSVSNIRKQVETDVNRVISA